jgi:hypothetical protein
MDDIRISLRSNVLTYAAITDIIDNRFHLDKFPENIAMPCVRMKTVSDVPMTNRSSSGIGRIAFQLECYSEDTIEASQLAQVFRDIYDGYEGAIGNFNTRVLVKDVSGDWSSETRLFMRMIEMDIGYVG